MSARETAFGSLGAPAVWRMTLIKTRRTIRPWPPTLRRLGVRSLVAFMWPSEVYMKPGAGRAGI